MKFLFIFLGLSGFCLLGQEQNNTVNTPNQVKVDPISQQKRISELEDKVILLEKRIDQSNEELNDLKKSHKKILDQSNVLQSEIKTSSTKSEKGLNSLKQTLSSQSNVLQSEIKTSSTRSEESLTSLKQALSSKIYWILGILILLGFLGSYVYRILSGRIHYLRDQIVKELEQQTQQLAKEGMRTETSDQSIDHTLAIRIANEVNRIERNISLLDPDTKGLKQINFSLSKLKDGLNAKGYIIEDLVGRDYEEEMNYKIVEIDESTKYKKGQTTITKVLLPSVHHLNKRVQVAEIKITKGLA